MECLIGFVCIYQVHLFQIYSMSERVVEKQAHPVNNQHNDRYATDLIFGHTDKLTLLETLMNYPQTVCVANIQYKNADFPLNNLVP